MVSFDYPVYNQIRLLVTNLSKKSFKSTTVELKDLARLYGDDARLFVLRCLLEEIDFHDHKSQKDHFKIQLLLQELGDLALQPNFTSIICRALQSNDLSSDFFGHFVKAAKLPFSQVLLIALGLAQSIDKSVRGEGLKYLKAKMQDSNDFSNEKLPDHVLHQLIYFVRESDDIPAKQKSAFISSLESIYPEACSSITLSPLLHDAQNQKSPEDMKSLIEELSAVSKPGAMLREVGLVACETPERLREFLSHFPKLAPMDVAEIIVALVKPLDKPTDDPSVSSVLSLANAVPGDVRNSPAWQNYVKLAKSGMQTAENKGGDRPKEWNLEAFVQTMKGLFPQLDWMGVYMHLDMPSFYVADSRGLNIMLRIFQLGTKGGAFPIDILFRPWNNRAGQLSLIRQVVHAPSHAFSFLNQPRTLRAEEGSAQGVSWLSLDLLESLLRLSETDLFGEVRELVSKLEQQCPELLLCGLVQIVTTADPALGGVTLRDEFVAALMPLHLGKATVLARLWGIGSETVVKWMVRLYAESRTYELLSEFVKFAQENKSALQVVLQTQHFAFAIDMACVASQSGLLPLDRWLQSQISRHSQPFAAACLDHLRDRVLEDTLGKGTVTLEVAGPMYKVLLASKPVLSAESVPELDRMYVEACSANAALAAQTLPVDDIEEEANAYFQKIYAQELSLNNVVEMLHRFKGSESKRERDVYACMIHNLFDEYRFFHKYPPKELGITGTLFGLLIQHKLVSSFTLGIALRYVLEALRKSPDSKMFNFGMWALRQFKDRLFIWPQYCNLIAEIPHLATEHPDLLAFLHHIQSQTQGQASTAPPGSQEAADEAAAAGVAAEAAMPQMTGGVSKLKISSSDEPAATSNAPAATQSSFTPNTEAKTAPVKEPPVEAPAEAPPASSVPPPTLASTASDVPLPKKPVSLAAHQSEPQSKERSESKEAPIGAKTGGFGSALNIDTLLSVERSGPLPPAPAESTKDKIHFIINNVSKQNIKQKGKKLKEVLAEEYYPYFARYLVVKRVSIENNFQKLYAEFLECVGVPKLDKQLVATTYEYIKVLLSSEKILSSSSERSLLKNLGSWLGLLTIAKNKPLRANKLNVKNLVLQAYEAGRLIAVVPFVAKVLEACSKSKVFKPPNPWLMALVGLLKEIFELPDLKLNLKFEIEVLFNNLSIKMKDVKASVLLKGRTAKGTNSFKNFRETAAPGAKVAGPAQADPMRPSPNATPRTTPPATPAYPPAQPANSLSVPALTATPEGEGDAQASGTPSAQFSSETTIIPNLPSYVTIHPNIALFSMYPHLKRCVPTAIDRAIREIITPVVERSVTIACVTTRELVMKDFAMEPDENKMRKAAHQMVQKLTSSLAEVTCKEPLRVSINNHLGSLLEANSNSNERTLVEHACTQVSSDNLELGITLIEKAASDRAIREIEEALGPMLQVRRKHREQTGQPYYDMSIFVSGNGRFNPSSLPEPLRPKPGGLNPMQLRVYDDFSTIPAHQATAKDAAGQKPTEGIATPSTMPTPVVESAAPPANAAAQSTRSGTASPSGAAPAAAAAGGAPLNSQQTLDKLIGCLANMEQAVARFPNHKNTPLTSLPSVGARGDHEINVLLRMVPTILNQCPREEAAFPRDVLAFTFAHKVFKRLYERDNRHSLLQIDVHIQVLKCIRDICPKIVKELTTWLLFSDDERKCLIPITTGLIRARMLNIPDLDLYLAKLVHGVHASGQLLQTRNLNQTLHPHLDLIISLVSRTVVKEPILASAELNHLFDALGKLQSVSQRRNKPVAEVLAHLLTEVRSAAAAAQAAAETQGQQSVAAAAAAQKLEAEKEQQQLHEQQVRDRQDAKVVDEATSQLLVEEAAMDREPWDDEPAQFRDRVVYLLEDWMGICLQGTASDKTYAQYLALLQQQRVLANPESTSRFFLIITQLCVDSAFNTASFPSASGAASDAAGSSTTQGAAAAKSGVGGMALNPQQQHFAQSLAQQAQQPAQLSYTAIDALAKLVVFLVKFFVGGENPSNPSSNPNAPKIRMLNAFLRAACRVLRRDSDLSGRAVRSGKGPGNFNQRPYFRLFANLLHHLNTPDPSLDSNNVEVLMAFGHCFRLLRPSRVPSFCFAWLELIAHRMFMSKLLISKSHQCAVLFEHLLVDLFAFMQPYLRNANLTDSVRMLYKGTLRVLLVLLHDFPEFLCEFHFSFCDVIPPTCIQMRNLILSAFPRSMRLPDPFTPNLKVDLLPDISQPPRILSDLTAQLAQHRASLMQPLDSYLAKRGPPSFLPQIRGVLLLPSHQHKKAGTKYNVPLINSLVLYVGCQGIAKLQSKSGLVAQFQDNACMDVFEVMVTSLDGEGRYYVLNAIANQLRYPNNHTHYFSCVLLYLFLQSKQAVIMEQITRVLLERLIVHRPHPWGLLITFIELIKNPRYAFWKQSFTRCAPEIERLFESVARSCMPAPKPAAPGAPHNLGHPVGQQHPSQHPAQAPPMHGHPGHAGQHPQHHQQAQHGPPHQQHVQMPHPSHHHNHPQHTHQQHHHEHPNAN